MVTTDFSFVVIGAGIYGLYAVKMLAERGERVALVECEAAPFTRASYINQARVHCGYHYPRSIYTAAKSAHYFERFNMDFGFAIHDRFRKIYAISRANSLTNAEQFMRFCRHVGIRCDEINALDYFRPGVVEAAFETEEYAVDLFKLRDYFMECLRQMPNVTFKFGHHLVRTENDGERYTLFFRDRSPIRTPAVLNATYASTNQVSALFGFDPFRIKSELCEVILVRPSPALENVGITVMDGPFFSVMPFGLTGWHSLTTVSHTPHFTSYDPLPEFECQRRNPNCSPKALENCNTCPAKPMSAWPYMSQLAKKYLNGQSHLEFGESLFSMKAILLAAETNDARPTVVRQFSEKPLYVSVLSGKLNTVYDLEGNL